MKQWYRIESPKINPHLLILTRPSRQFNKVQEVFSANYAGIAGYPHAEAMERGVVGMGFLFGVTKMF